VQTAKCMVLHAHPESADVPCYIFVARLQKAVNQAVYGTINVGTDSVRGGRPIILYPILQGG